MTNNTPRAPEPREDARVSEARLRERRDELHWRLNDHETFKDASGQDLADWQFARSATASASAR